MKLPKSNILYSAIGIGIVWFLSSSQTKVNSINPPSQQNNHYNQHSKKPITPYEEKEDLTLMKAILEEEEEILKETEIKNRKQETISNYI